MTSTAMRDTLATLTRSCRDVLAAVNAAETSPLEAGDMLKAISSQIDDRIAPLEAQLADLEETITWLTRTGNGHGTLAGLQAERAQCGDILSDFKRLSRHISKAVAHLSQLRPQ